MPKKAKKDTKPKAPPKVYKVKDPEPDGRYSDLHPHLPQPPALLLIIGSVKQGKSNLVVNLLCNPDMYKDKFDIVKIISNTLNADPKGKLLNKFFDCADHYSDQMITDIVESQKSFDEEDRPTMAVILDDILTKDFKKTNQVSFLATKFRHYGIDLLAFTTQSFRAVSGLIRNNSTDVIIMKQQNQKELEKIAEEYGDMFPGIFMDLYNKAINDAPYSFLYLDLQQNPAEAFIRFETKIAEGGTKLF
jgi:hypothetical protein